MHRETLPERLRYLSTRFALREHAEQVGDLMREAADELERLTRPLTREGVRALHGDLGELAGRLTPAGGRDWRAVALMARDELVRLAGECERLEQLASPARMLALGTSAKVAERLAAGLPDPSPMSRRFAVRYLGGWGPPAAGSFVFAGPALAVWRVLTVDELAGHVLPPGLGMGEPLPATHALELEPVDGHDVPMLARVAEVPAPIDELDGDALYSEPADDDGEADS